MVAGYQILTNTFLACLLGFLTTVSEIVETSTLMNIGLVLLCQLLTGS